MAGGDGVTTYESEERQNAHNILPPRHIRVCLCLSVFLCVVIQLRQMPLPTSATQPRQSCRVPHTATNATAVMLAVMYPHLAPGELLTAEPLPTVAEMESKTFYGRQDPGMDLPRHYYFHRCVSVSAKPFPAFGSVWFLTRQAEDAHTAGTDEALSCEPFVCRWWEQADRYLAKGQ